MILLFSLSGRKTIQALLNHDLALGPSNKIAAVALSAAMARPGKKAAELMDLSARAPYTITSVHRAHCRPRRTPTPAVRQTAAPTTRITINITYQTPHGKMRTPSGGSVVKTNGMTRQAIAPYARLRFAAKVTPRGRTRGAMPEGGWSVKWSHESFWLLKLTIQWN